MNHFCRKNKKTSLPTTSKIVFKKLEFVLYVNYSTAKYKLKRKWDFVGKK